MVTMNPDQSTSPNHAIKILAKLNQITLKAYQAKTQEVARFVMLNDTISVVPFDRTVFWSFQGKRPRMEGVSGQADVARGSALEQTWHALLKSLKEPHKLRVLETKDFEKEKLFDRVKDSQEAPNVLWVPLLYQDELIGGLWMERWNKTTWADEEKELLRFLALGFAAAWERFRPTFLKRLMNRKKLLIVASLAFLSLFIVHLPLRIVAPCEIVPDKPYLITAPLEGIIEEIVARPGQAVKEDDLLFTYDKRVPLQQLQTAKKQVEIVEKELQRALTLSWEEKDPLNEIALLYLRLEKEKLGLELVEYQASKLDVRATKSGIVVADDVDSWRGKPVQLGERVLQIADPEKHKLRIWLPEQDNVHLPMGSLLKVYLNVRPEKSYSAKLSYISSYTSLDDHQVSSFMAEANWATDDPDLTLGLKGTAVLHGDSVTLFYWIFRRPWTFTRRYFGL